MEDSPLFDGIREKWVEQGKEQGIQQGIQDAILDALGSYPEKVVKCIRGIKGIDELKILLRRAVKAKTRDEFITALEDETAGGKISNRGRPGFFMEISGRYTV